MILYQLFSTDIWGSHSTRTSLGIYSDPNTALYYGVTNHQDHVCDALIDDGRLFVEAITVDEPDSGQQIYDSSLDDTKNILYKIMVFEAGQHWSSDLGFRANVGDSDEDEEFVKSLESWETYEDVKDSDLDYVLGEDRDHGIICKLFEEDLAESI